MKKLTKKAQGLNYLAVIILLFFFGFLAIVVYTVWIEFVSSITASGFLTGQALVTSEAFTRGFQAFDWIMVLLMVFLILGVGLTSFKIATSPAFFIITFISGIFWGLIAYFFNFIFIQLVTPDVFSLSLGAFPRTILICTNLHWVMLANIIVGSITLYAKKEKGQFLT